MWLLVAVLAAANAAAQTQTNPAFRDKQVEAFFHKENPRIHYFRTLLRRPVSANEDVLVVLGGSPDVTWQRDPKSTFWVPGDRLGIFKTATGDRTRAEQIAILTGENKDCAIKIERVDASSLTLSCTGDYGIRDEFRKVFYDFRAARLLKVQTIAPASVSQIRGTEAIVSAREDWLRIDLAGPIPVLKRRVVREHEQVLSPPECEAKPPQETYPLPQSTQKELAAARPREKGEEIREEIGSCQMVGQTLWFGVHFWDGEGMTGVGRIGKFDFKTRQYSFLRPSGLRNFAASALLVEPDSVWVGLVRHPEGAPDPRGLLRWSPQSGDQLRYPVSEVILTIKRIGDVLWLGTSNGVFKLAEDRLTHYTVEPALNGGYELKEARNLSAGV